MCARRCSIEERFLQTRLAMNSPVTLAPGIKVETGDAGTPSYKVGLVLGTADAHALGRNEEEPSALIAWESGEEEWAELSTLRVAAP